MNKKIVASFASITLLVLPTIAFALASVQQIITNLMDFIVWPIFVGAVVIMFVWAGFLFVTANGDPTKISTARKAVLWAVVGVVVGLVAFSIINVIYDILFFSF